MKKSTEGPMARIKVSELAKELHKSSREIIVVLKRHGIDVESHSTLLPESFADRIRLYYKRKDAAGSAGKTVKKRKAAARRNQAKETIAAGFIDSHGNYSTETEEDQEQAARQVAEEKKSDASLVFDGRSPARRAAQAQRRETAARTAPAAETQTAAAAPAEKTGEAAAVPVQTKADNADRNEEITEQAAGQKEAAARSAQAEQKEEAAGAAQADVVDRAADAEEKAAADKAPETEQKAAVAEAADAVSTEKKASAQQPSAEKENAAQKKAPEKREEQHGPVDRSPARDGARNSRDGFSGRGSRENNRSRGEGRDGRDSGRNEGRSRDGGRSFNRDGSRNSQSRGTGRDNNRNGGHSEGRSGSYDHNRSFGGNRNSSRGGEGKRFADAAASAAPAKDTTRETRRNYKDKTDRRDYEDKNERQGRNGKGRGKNAVRNNRPERKPETKQAAVEKVASITIPETLTIQDLAAKMKIPTAKVIQKEFLAGKVYTINSDLTYEEAEEIALDFDILCEPEKSVAEDKMDAITAMLQEDEDKEEDMVSRPPVVCVMGYVDHGKTSILDAIRHTHVTSGEAGGITQHIGAYVVNIKGQKITFLDTPGHEAFTAMRLRGAQSTDIAILVVAADDGVMPQTIEAINHAKAAGIDIIVAINKIDKPGANVERVKQELMEYDLVAEEWGGKTIMVPVSAHTGEGLDDLLDMVLLDAEMLDLKANPNRKGRGLILEAKLDKGRGPVASVLVQKGTLRVEDNITVGTAYGRIRAMVDDKGRRVKTAGPSTPVEILGLNDVPQAGEIIIATDNEKTARSMAETFIATNREKLLHDTKQRLTLDSLFSQIKEGQVRDLNIIIKADVQGSVEAVKQSLSKLSNEEVAVKVIHGGVGAINESDVTLASASNAIIIGFNVRPDNQAKAVAEEENVDIRLYRVIYNAIEDIEAALKGMLAPKYQEKIIGHAEVRKTYKVSGVGTIIGGYVTDGQISRGCKVRLLRDNVVAYEGELASLKRFQDDVKEVNSGYECGMSLAKYNDIKEGDQIEAYIIEEIPR